MRQAFDAARVFGAAAALLACVAFAPVATAQESQRGDADGEDIQKVAAQIKAALEAKSQDVSSCYESLFARDPFLSAGSVSVRVFVMQDGSVSHVKATSKTLESHTSEECVVDKFEHLRFPKNKLEFPIFVDHVYRVGGFSKDEIRKVIRSSRSVIERCYDDVLSKGDEATGMVKVRFRIAASGSVEQVSITKSTVNHPALERCVVDTIRALVFPKPMGSSPVIVNYPFNFSIEESDEDDAEETSAEQPPPREVTEQEKVKREVPLPDAARANVVSMDTRAIRAVILEHRGELEVCFKEAQARGGEDVFRAVDISFTIGKGGEVTSVSARRGGEALESLEACMLEKMSTWRFPEPPGGTVVVRYPLTTDPIP